MANILIFFQTSHFPYDFLCIMFLEHAPKVAQIGLGFTYGHKKRKSATGVPYTISFTNLKLLTFMKL